MSVIPVKESTTSVDIKFILLLLRLTGNSHISLHQKEKCLSYMTITWNIFMISLKFGLAIISSLAVFLSSSAFQVIEMFYFFVRLVTTVQGVSFFLLSRQGVLDSQFWWKASDNHALFLGKNITWKRRLFYIFYILASLCAVVYIGTFRVIALPGCRQVNSTWFNEINCRAPHLFIIVSMNRIFQNCLTLAYIYINSAILATKFERLSHTLSTGFSGHDKLSKVEDYRKQYGYLSQCVSSFNDKIGFNTTMTLLYLMIQVVVKGIYTDNGLPHSSSIDPTLILSFLGFSLMMYGAICLSEAVSLQFQTST